MGGDIWYSGKLPDTALQEKVISQVQEYFKHPPEGITVVPGLHGVKTIILSSGHKDVEYPFNFFGYIPFPGEDSHLGQFVFDRNDGGQLVTLTPSGSWEEDRPVFGLQKEGYIRGGGGAFALLLLRIQRLYWPELKVLDEDKITDEISVKLKWICPGAIEDESISVGEILNKFKEAGEWENVLANMDNGDAYALWRMAKWILRSYVTSKTYSEEELKEEAFEMLTDSADEGFEWAQCDLADIYSDRGSYLSDKYHDMEKALHYYCLAARQGSEEAKQRLADQYRRNTRSEYRIDNLLNTDHAFRSKWLLESANVNVKESLCQIGNAHLSGDEFCEKSIGKALLRFHAAARQSHGEAEYILGKCFLDGKLVDKDLSYAVKWLLRAQEHWCQDAIKILLKIKSPIKHIQTKSVLPSAMLSITLDDYWGFSPEVYKKLADAGITTIKDIVGYSLEALTESPVSLDSTHISEIASLFDILDVVPLYDINGLFTKLYPPHDTRPRNNMRQRTMGLFDEIEAAGRLLEITPDPTEQDDDIEEFCE